MFSSGVADEADIDEDVDGSASIDEGGYRRIFHATAPCIERRMAAREARAEERILLDVRLEAGEV